ncbi:Rv1733c family protein [Streptomyces clavifer]|uniref:Rv1733c family protein n=1 Tax=Streptomyces clavifer TaxID=68188 RepID=UPI003F4B46A3
MYAARGSRRWRTHPLRRKVDVLEARLWLLVAVLALMCASSIGVAQGWAAFDREASVAAEQRADRHLVRATVLRDATSPSPWTDESGRSPRVPVPARWVTPTGGEGTGKVLVAPGTERGERTRLWLDSRGTITSAPLEHHDVWAEALLEGGSGAAVAIGAGALAGFGVRMACNRRRATLWESEWSRVEPEWSRRT